jgi:hypothetical protein
MSLKFLDLSANQLTQWIAVPDTTKAAPLAHLALAGNKFEVHAAGWLACRWAARSLFCFTACDGCLLAYLRAARRGRLGVWMAVGKWVGWVGALLAETLGGMHGGAAWLKLCSTCPNLRRGLGWLTWCY